MSLSAWSAAVLGLVTLYLALYRLQLRKGRPDEPPVVAAPGLPFFGHVLGMGIQGGRYMQQLCRRLQRDAPSAGVFALPVPGSRIYLVTDPALAAAAQRATRTLSFTPVAPEVTRRILGFDDAAMDIVRTDNVAVAASPIPSAASSGAMTVIDDQKYDESYGFMADMHHLIYTYMQPGDTLNRVILDASTELVGHVTTYATGIESASASTPPVVNLLAWIKHMVTVGAAHYFYGPRNPVAMDASLEPAFWDFVRGLGRLLVVGAPNPPSRVASILGGRPLAAREQLISGFVRYLEAREAHEHGSDYVQRRMAIAERYGWTTDGLARSELSFYFASIINTAITSFWVVLRLFADPALLNTVRAELDGNGDGDTLSIAHICNGGCPMLRAVFDETLRLGSNNMTTRLVLTDTLLADRYFLRAGSVLQIPAGMVHADPAVWGDNVGEFDPARFLKSGGDASASANNKRHRAFGGGKTLCPGRHFATAEILVLAAAIVQMFDMEDATAGVPPHTPPRVPPHNDRVLPVHILEPAAKDVPHVRLRLRRPGRPVQVVA